MNERYALPLLPNVVGAILAVNALTAPFGNTGVDGTLGAVLAVIGSVAATLLVTVIMVLPLPRGWFVTLNILAMLAALLTAIAALFLMQTLLAIAMSATFLTLAFDFFTGSRRTH